jgi:hypothetical protein
MKQQLHLATPGSCFDLLAAGQQSAGARFQAEPVERSLAQRHFDPIGQVGGNRDLARLEGAGQAPLSLPLA